MCACVRVCVCVCACVCVCVCQCVIGFCVCVVSRFVDRMETEYDYLFKIVLIGDAGVGKTSIVRRYTDGIFTSAGIPTIGVDFCIKTLHIGSSAVKVSLLEHLVL